jgi:hypothetical protein
MKYSLIVMLATSSAAHLMGQAKTDTVFVSQSVASAVQVYDKFIHGQELYYNGSAYVEPPRTGEEHSFYLSEDWQFGDLYFDGDYYKNVPLQYDIMIDQLIGESASGNMQVLPKEKVKFFTLSGERFEYIDNKKVNNSLPGSGFYHILYSGPTKVVAQLSKSYQEKVESGELHTYFIERTRYFIFKDGSFVPVLNKNTLMKVLKDQRAELRAFMRKNKLGNKDRDLMMAQVANQYDILTSQAK